MARRPTKLEFHEHRVTCTYCGKDITVYSLMEDISAAPRTCPNCRCEITIDHCVAVRPSAGGEKKPPKQVRSRPAKAQNG